MVASSHTAARVVRRSTGRARRAVAAHARLQLNHSPDRAVIVAGSGRSGTTWLAEMLAEQLRGRLVFEPFHPVHGPLRDRVSLFHTVDAVRPEFRSAVEQVFAGRVRSAWTDRPPQVRLSQCRVVKDIHAMNILPWLRNAFPLVPAILIVRHPLAVAASRLRNTGVNHWLAESLDTQTGLTVAAASPLRPWLPAYRRYRSDSNQAVRDVAAWCIENVYALEVAAIYGIRVTFYEDLVLDTHAELHRLSSDLGLERRGGRRQDPARPSSTDWYGTAAGARSYSDRAELLTEWRRRLPRATIAACLDVLAEFDLIRVYDDDPAPTHSVHRER